MKHVAVEQGAGQDRSAGQRPRIVYVSYDGAGEPLGQSQVLGYLRLLAKACDITLISFEKGDESRSDTASSLRSAGITWLPHPYHRRPAGLSTLRDVIAGARAVGRACRRSQPDIVHVRGYVPALMALCAAWPGRRRWKLLFDMRGFWADERVLADAWSERSLLFRLAKRCEQWFFAEADAVVTLTDASVPRIRTWMGARQAPVRVIPTCTDVDCFSGFEPRGSGPRAVWCGSIGSFYRFELAVRFVDALRIPFLVLTRQVEAAKAQIGDREADIRTIPHQEIPAELRPGDIGLCFYAGGELGNLGRAPTRIAEYLASGMVVAITPGVGDLDAIVAFHNIGVRIEDESKAGLAAAAAKARALAADSDVQARGPQIAAELFSVEDGANAYLDLYRVLRRNDANAPSGNEPRSAGTMGGTSR